MCLKKSSRVQVFIAKNNIKKQYKNVFNSNDGNDLFTVKMKQVCIFSYQNNHFNKFLMVFWVVFSGLNPRKIIS